MPRQARLQKMCQELTLYFKQTMKTFKFFIWKRKKRRGRWREGEISFHQAARDHFTLPFGRLEGNCKAIPCEQMEAKDLSFHGSGLKIRRLGWWARQGPAAGAFCPLTVRRLQGLLGWQQSLGSTSAGSQQPGTS